MKNTTMRPPIKANGGTEPVVHDKGAEYTG